MKDSYTIAEVATLAGVRQPLLMQARRLGLVPEPKPVGGYRRRYAVQEMRQIVAYFQTTTPGAVKASVHGLYSLAEAARRIGVRPTTLYYHIETNGLPAPTRKPGQTRKFYDEAELGTLKQALAGMGGRERHQARQCDARNRAGLYSAGEAARKLGIPHITFTDWRKKGRVPKPTATFPRYPFKLWTEADLRAIRQEHYDYFAARLLQM